MSSSDEDVPLEKRKKSHSDRLKKKVKNGRSSKHLNDDDKLENIALTANDLIKKYKNISRSELEEICERVLIYDQTGLYIPPDEFRHNCQLKKNKQKHRSLKPREENSKPAKEKFGKGQIGVGHDTFGHSVCSCCNNVNPEHHYHIPSGEVKVESTSHVNPPTSIFPKLEPFPDLNQPSCSGAHNFDESNSILPDDILAFVESLNFNMDNSISELETSLSEDNRHTAGENVSGASSSSSNLPNLLNDSLQILNETQFPGSEVIDLATSAYNLRERPSATDESIVVVDLTNVTPVVNRQLHSSNLDVIELIDDSDLIPNVVETINLIDSDSENDSAPGKAKKSLNDTLVDGKPVIECPVCLESLKNKKVMSTTCGHIFCSRCIRNVVKKTKCCPNCRKKLKPSNIHPLYVNF